MKQPLTGVTVQLKNNQGDFTAVDLTDEKGHFQFNVPTGNYSLIATYVGYETYSSFTDISKNDSLVIYLKKGIDLITAVVTYDRTLGRKMIDLPASISVLSSEEIKKVPVMGVESRLSKIHGINVSAVGIDRNEIALRGLNKPLNNQLLVLTDYLPQWSASDGNFIYNAMPIPPIDLERAEVVRGGMGTTYGPGAIYGAVHFITRSPFNDPGTSLQIFGGNQSFFGGAFRHAGILGNKKKWAYKIVGEYTHAEEWSFDENDPEDLSLVAGDITPRDYKTEKIRLRGELRYRFGEKKKSEFINTFSYTENSFLLTAPDAIQVQGANVFTHQLRFRSGGFWLQGSWNQSFGDPALVLRIPDPVETEKPYHSYVRNFTWGFQGQYAWDVWEEKHTIVAGADYTRRELNSKDPRHELLKENGITERSTNYGRFENRAEASTYGFFVHSDVELIENKLNLNASFRTDINQINANKPLFSPFIGLNYHIKKNHTLRFSAHRGWTNIPMSDYYKDRKLFFARDLGNIDGFNFLRNNGDPIFSTGPAAALAFFSQLNPFSADYETTTPIAHLALLNGLQVVLNDNLNDPETLARMGFTSETWLDIIPELLPLIIPSENILDSSDPIYALTQITGQPVSPAQLENIPALKDYYWDIFEIGYQGFINNKFIATLDVFYNRAQRTEIETLITPSLNLRNEKLFHAAEIAFSKNGDLIDLLNANNLTLNDWMTIYQNFASVPMYIWETAENNIDQNGEAELMQSVFLTPKGIDYWGLSMELKYLIQPDLTIYGSYSYLNKKEWQDDELGLPGSGFRKTMNAPPHMVKVGLAYFQDKGISLTVDGIYEAGFPFLERSFVGDIDEKYLLNASVGYDLGKDIPDLNGLRIDFSATNITGKKYRTFLGAPKIGRFLMGRLSYSF